MNAQFKPIIVQPGSGQDLFTFGIALSRILSGEQTGGTLALASEWASPGGGPDMQRSVDIHHEHSIQLLGEAPG
jgi:hypothetical protein